MVILQIDLGIRLKTKTEDAHDKIEIFVSSGFVCHYFKKKDS